MSFCKGKRYRYSFIVVMASWVKTRISFDRDMLLNRILWRIRNRDVLHRNHRMSQNTWMKFACLWWADWASNYAKHPSGWKPNHWRFLKPKDQPKVTLSHEESILLQMGHWTVSWKFLVVVDLKIDFDPFVFMASLYSDYHNTGSTLATAAVQRLCGAVPK